MKGQVIKRTDGNARVSYHVRRRSFWVDFESPLRFDTYEGALAHLRSFDTTDEVVYETGLGQS